MKKLIAALAVVALAPTTALAMPLEEPALPSVDRLSPYIKARLGDSADVGIRVCITPDGHVANVAIVRSSTFVAFDEAVKSDIGEWRYAASDAYHCMRTRITYQAR